MEKVERKEQTNREGIALTYKGVGSNREETE